ncbi:MAG: glutamate--cysteine ligase, partial [Candidatus Competibacteraceae bacterium]|nr:glutamate--cysteine ligase [Candidatus Competibacteraceae bacterium]
MGQEIDKHHFHHQDFQLFEQRLREETETLQRWYRDGHFSRHPSLGGFELEAWLVDQQGRPAPIGPQFLARLDRHLVTTELANFNVELNASPQTLNGRALHRMEDELTRNWAVCQGVARDLDSSLVMIGILPSVERKDFHFGNMAPLNRYHALNEQTLRLRGGQPLHIDIQGRDHLVMDHDSVMLESATTSFQLHLQVAAVEAVRIYNAAQILAAPMVAIAANSPYLFGHDLWDETRISLFEQSVDARDLSGGYPDLPRVTFG